MALSSRAELIPGVLNNLEVLTLISYHLGLASMKHADED